MNAHILCLDCFPIWGGGEVVLVKQVGQLLRDRYRVTVVCPSDSPLLAGQLPAGTEALGIPMSTTVTDFARSASSLRVLPSQARLATQLGTIMCRQQVSLVYALGSRSAKAALPSVIALRLPLCWSAHNTYRLGALDRLLVRHSAAVMCVSIALQQDYARLAKDRSKVHLLYNGIDATTSSRPHELGFRRELGLADHDILVSMIGRISREKGQVLFVEAMQPLIREFDYVHAAIIGASTAQEQDYEREVRGAINRGGAGKRFHMTGWRNDIPSVLPELDIVALTSTREAFSMVILEAMAASRPVAAFDAGGVAEAIQDGITGLVVPVGDVSAMTHAVRRLVVDPIERVTMGRAAQQRARAMFDDAILLPQFAEIISAVLEQYGQ
jgi:glycosyltransferase involved in cell wall biosynthesis